MLLQNSIAAKTIFYLNSSECKRRITAEYRILNGPNFWWQLLDVGVDELVVVDDVGVDDISTVATQIVEEEADHERHTVVDKNADYMELQKVQCVSGQGALWRFGGRWFESTHNITKII